MARDLGFVSPLTFIQENGRPLKFFMKPCNLRNKLSRIIEEGGGILTSELTNSEEIIRLTDPEKPVEGFVSSEFVFDSIEKKVLQDINQYRIKSKKTNPSTEIVRTDDDEDDAKTVNQYTKRRVKVVNYEEMSDLEDAPKSHSPSKTLKKKKRMRYTDQDDAAILKYLEEEDGYTGMHKLHGNIIWKKMAQKKVTNHTWQSMRKHFIEILQVRNNLQEGQRTLTKKYSADCDSSGKDDIVDTDSDFEIQRKKEKNQSRSARDKHKASTSHDNADDQKSDGITTRDKDSIDDRHLDQGLVTSGQHKASSSNNDSDDLTSGDILTTDNEPLKNEKCVVNRRREKGVEPETDEQRSGRAITRGQQKTLKSTDDTEDHQVVTRKQGTKSHVRPEEENEEVQESESDDESSPDTFEEYSHQVPRQLSLVFQSKDRDQQDSSATGKHQYLTRGGVPSPKRRSSVPSKESHIYPEIRVTIVNHQDEVERDSDSDDFDQRLLSLAEKASFDRNCQESQDHEEVSEDETSAKDTQEDDEDEYIFRTKNRRKRTERNKNQGISSAKRKCTDNEDKRTLRVTRDKSSTEKCSVNQAHGNSVTSPSSYESPSKSPHRRRKREKTPETCSRNLFGDDADEHESTPVNGKAAATAKTPGDDEMGLYVEKMVENFRKVEKLPCTQGMTRSQLLHALYVSNGVVKDTESYIKTGKLTNGARPWCKEDNDILMRSDSQTGKTVVKKRSQSSVWERKAFLRGCK